MKLRKRPFIFSREKCKKNISIFLNYHISKFLDLFNFCKKGLEKIALLVTEGVMCYEYTDSWKKSKEKSLPLKEKFFSSLNNKGTPDWDYKHAQGVWNMFKMK